MRTRRTNAIFILLALVGGALAFYLLVPREPVSEGKPLSFWVDQYITNHWLKLDKALDEQAQTAIRKIGAQARPVLLKRLGTRESALRMRLTAHIPKVWLARFHILNVEEYRAHMDEYRTKGAYGLAALGPEAKPAVPALITLLNDKNNRVRYLAVFTLRCLGPVARDALPVLIPCLNDPDFAIRDDAVTALGTIHAEPERVVPILVKFLEKNREDEILCMETVEALGSFGAEAKSSVPILLGLFDSSYVNVRASLANSLGLIGPEARDAVPGLLKCLHDPEFRIRYCSTIALGEIHAKPDLVIPALIEMLDDSPRPRLLQFLNYQDYGTRVAVTNALMQIDPEAAAKAGIK